MGPWRRDVCRIARPNTALASPTTMGVCRDLVEAMGGTLRIAEADGRPAVGIRLRIAARRLTCSRSATPARVPLVLRAEPAALHERSHEEQVLDLPDGPLLSFDRQP